VTLNGAPDRLSMAMLRGTRGWSSQEEAGKLLCPANERQRACNNAKSCDKSHLDSDASGM